MSVDLSKLLSGVVSAVTRKGNLLTPLIQTTSVLGILIVALYTVSQDKIVLYVFCALLVFVISLICYRHSQLLKTNPNGLRSEEVIITQMKIDAAKGEKKKIYNVKDFEVLPESSNEASVEIDQGEKK